MTDAIHSVADYDDLVAVDAPTERCRTHIAVLLSEGADAVVWLPEWLVGDKALAPSHAHPQLFVGEAYDYSEKALAVEQPDNDTEYVPKSEAEAFCLADGVTQIDTPQTGLGSFEVDS